MPTIEHTINLAAICYFSFLLYRLSLVVCSLPVRLKALKDQLAAITCLDERMIEQFEQVRTKQANCTTLDVCFRNVANQYPQARRMIELVWKAARQRSIHDHIGADRLVEKCIDDLAQNYHRHFSLASLATETGMLFTVIGGMLAFQHIGTSDSPFAAFPSLALAMLTTAAGLVISITVKTAIGKFENMLEPVATCAMDVSVTLGQSLSILKIHPSKVRPKTTAAAVKESNGQHPTEGHPPVEDQPSSDPSAASQMNHAGGTPEPKTPSPTGNDTRDYIFSH